MSKERSGAVKSPLDRLVSAFLQTIGGGRLKYRTRGCWVEMKGGGTGLFWGFAHLIPFDTNKQAEIFAKKWAANEGGEYVR